MVVDGEEGPTDPSAIVAPNGIPRVVHVQLAFEPDRVERYATLPRYLVSHRLPKSNSLR